MTLLCSWRWCYGFYTLNFFFAAIYTRNLDGALHPNSYIVRACLPTGCSLLVVSSSEYYDSTKSTRENELSYNFTIPVQGIVKLNVGSYLLVCFLVRCIVIVELDNCMCVARDINILIC